jgi:hypothetical protein
MHPQQGMMHCHYLYHCHAFFMSGAPQISQGTMWAAAHLSSQVIGEHSIVELKIWCL